MNSNETLYSYIMTVAEPRFGQDSLAFDNFAEQVGDMLDEANDKGYELELTQKFSGDRTIYTVGYYDVDTNLLYF